MFKRIYVILQLLIGIRRNEIDRQNGKEWISSFLHGNNFIYTLYESPDVIGKNCAEAFYRTKKENFRTIAYLAHKIARRCTNVNHN